MRNVEQGRLSAGQEWIEPAEERTETARPKNGIMFGAFAIIAFFTTFPYPTRFTTEVAGDYGDPMFVLWVLRSLPESVPEGWAAMWNAGIFQPGTNTLAYSDHFAPLAVLHWPLARLIGDVAAFNLIYVAAWTSSMFFMYLLVLWITRSWPASFLGALLYTLATARLAQYVHHQLVIGCLFPLLVLLLLRLLERPSVRRGAIVGAVLGVITLWASYYGIAAASLSVVIIGGYVLARRAKITKRHVTSVATAAAVAGILIAPFAYQYLALQRDPHFRRAPEPQFSTHLGDLVAVSPANRILIEVPPFRAVSTDATRTIENRLFPGIVALSAAAIGMWVLIRALRGRPLPPLESRRARFGTLLILTAGVVFLFLSFGDSLTVMGSTLPMPYRLLRHVPGLAGIRVTARFFVLTQLAIAVLAAVGLAAVFARMSVRWRTAVFLVLVALVLTETATTITTVEVPSKQEYGATNEALAGNASGLVLELPILSSADGPAWAYVEAPRQVLAPLDGHPRVNGYSGFEPESFPAMTVTLNEFPSVAALDLAERLGVRYVVLRTALVGDVDEWLEPLGQFSNAEARAIIADIPRDRLVSVEPVNGAYIIELTGPAANRT